MVYLLKHCKSIS